MPLPHLFGIAPSANGFTLVKPGGFTLVNTSGFTSINTK
jgi:hypothetical protein